MILKDKVAIITGASQGLGKEIFLKYVEAGAKVVICARNEEQLMQTFNEAVSKTHEKDRIVMVRADISKEDEAFLIVKTTIESFGKVDILVNNAGIHGAKGSIDEIDLKEWKQAIDINLYGTVHMICAVVSYMKKQKYGKIINLSGGGAASPRPFFSAYAASKAAIVRLTENFAMELKDYNIDINAIAPGAMNTRLLDDILNAGKMIGDEYQKALKQKEEGGVSPEIAADLCVHLASNKCDGVSGCLISALWDDWKNLDKHLNEISSSDIFKLRRIIPKDRGKDWD